MKRRPWAAAVLAAAVCLVPLGLIRADAPVPAATEAPSTAPAAKLPDVQKIDFTEETLPNGLKVVYAPLHQAPVCQVRMLYHVGSRDERPDRQGFAHMFEHMMFRGSAHVPPQEHMKLIDEVGGICNAFTSFDQTVYHDTIPSEDLGLALYLEADRMASFKVTDEIYQIERKVVAQEWMLQQNRPYGNMGTKLFGSVFTKSSYNWTPIGNMQHLLAAPASELQDFYNTYYVPNNAVLVIAGDFDLAKTKELVHKYYAWIPAGAPVEHPHTDEPAQTQARSATMPDRLAQLTEIVAAYKIPPYKSDDQYALSVLGTIMGGGATSRLERALVNNEHPLCASAGAGSDSLEYAGIFEVEGRVLPGKDAEAVKKILAEQVADIIKNGVTPEEMALAKTDNRVGTIRGRETCDQIAGDVGDAVLWADDANRVNTDLAKLDAVTAADVQAVAKKYLQPDMVTLVTVEPDPLGTLTRKAAAASGNSAGAAAALRGGAAVVASTQPIAYKTVDFPADYPTKPPLPPAGVAAHFEKGQETTVNGVHVIVLTDHRLPLVGWTLAMRRGSDSDPADKLGLAGMTAAMLTHGAGSLSYQQLSEELAQHGISLGVSAGGDNTRLSGGCTTEELDRGFARSRDVLMSPTFPADEFAKLKAQTQAGVAQGMASPAAAAGMEISHELYGDSPMGRHTTPEMIAAITLDDVKKSYAEFYHPDDAVLTISGDVSFEHGVELAKQLTDGWKAQPMPEVSYDLPAPSLSPKPIILIDNPDGSAGAGAILDMGIRAYDIHNPDKFAGSLASTILSSGIESRLMEYVRAEKGYVYGIDGTFQPGRHDGAFMVDAPTRPQVIGDCITSTVEVLDQLKNPTGKNPLTDEELAMAKRRVTGLMVMRMQTVGQQAGMRLDGILNGYPADYYDVYPEHINAVTVDQVRSVMDKYVKPDAMSVVVVAPASAVKEQLEKLGPVTVKPMPALRDQGTTRPTNEMMK
jgi:zinc protease